MSARFACHITVCGLSSAEILRCSLNLASLPLALSLSVILSRHFLKNASLRIPVPGLALLPLQRLRPRSVARTHRDPGGAVCGRVGLLAGRGGGGVQRLPAARLHRRPHRVLRPPTAGSNGGSGDAANSPLVCLRF